MARADRRLHGRSSGDRRGVGPAVHPIRYQRYHDHLQAAVRLLLLGWCVGATTTLAGQGPVGGVGTVAQTGVAFDAYYFGSGVAFEHVVEWTIPVSLSHRLGPELTIDLSSAYAHASAATTSGPLEISGATDADVRGTWVGVWGRVGGGVGGGGGGGVWGVWVVGGWLRVAVVCGGCWCSVRCLRGQV